MLLSTTKFNTYHLWSDPKIVEIYYWFSLNDIQISQEYLIYDLTRLIGSVGGTFGLFIGFSFYALVKRLICILEHYSVRLVPAKWLHTYVERYSFNNTKRKIAIKFV